MDDETALATFNELRRLDRSCRADEKLSRTRCHESRTLRDVTLFRILDLPVEVRVCIYEYAVQDKYVHRLRSFATPALARTSRQMRAESLPVWFAINTFVAEVKSTFVGISTCPAHGDKAEYVLPQDSRYRLAGRLNLSTIVTGLLATCPPSMVKLKNIDFCMLSAGPKQDGMRSDRFALLSVRHGRSIRITTHVGGGTNPEYSKHVHHVFDHGRRYLQQLVSDPMYQGLYMLQIKDVAAAFKAEAPPSLLPDSQPVPATVSLALAGQSRDSVGAAHRMSISEMPSAIKAVRPRSWNRADDDFDLPDAEAYFSL